jgi:hypothetical protein
MFGSGRSEDQLLAMLRGQLTDIVFGAVILFIGLTACSIAAVRRRSGVRLIIWLRIWSAMYRTGLSLMSPCKRTALMQRWPSMIAYWGAYDVTQRHAHLRAILSVDFEEPSVSGLG